MTISLRQLYASPLWRWLAVAAVGLLVVALIPRNTWSSGCVKTCINSPCFQFRQTQPPYTVLNYRVVDGESFLKDFWHDFDHDRRCVGSKPVQTHRYMTAAPRCPNTWGGLRFRTASGCEEMLSEVVPPPSSCEACIAADQYQYHN